MDDKAIGDILMKIVPSGMKTHLLLSDLQGQTNKVRDCIEHMITEDSEEKTGGKQMSFEEQEGGEGNEKEAGTDEQGTLAKFGERQKGSPKGGKAKGGGPKGGCFKCGGEHYADQCRQKGGVAKGKGKDSWEKGAGKGGWKGEDWRSKGISKGRRILVPKRVPKRIPSQPVAIMARERTRRWSAMGEIQLQQF